MKSNFPPPYVQLDDAEIVRRGVTMINIMVRVNGEDYGMHEVTINQAGSADAPGRLATQNGFASSGATIKWDIPMGATPDFVSMTVSANRPNFSDKMVIPSIGDKVEIWGHKSPASWSGGYYQKLFTGRVASHRIDGNTGGLITECVDYIDKLSKVVDVLPLAAVMPGRRRTDNGRYHPGVSLNTFVWDILEQCGYSPAAKSKLPLENNNQVLLYAPLQGSFMCNWRRGHGQLIDASGGSKWGEQSQPIFWFNWDEGTAYLNKGFATYETANGHNKIYDKSRDLILRGKNAPKRTGDTWINIYANFGGKNSSARFGILADGSIALEKVTKPMKLAPGARFELRISGDNWKCTQENGEYAEGTLNYLTLPNKSDIYAVEVYAAEGGRVCDLLLLNGDLPFSDRVQARVSPPRHSLDMDFTRSVRGRVAREVLQEIAEIYSCIMWHDAEGVLNIMNVPRMFVKNTRNIIYQDEIITADVQMDSTKVASSVAVSYNIPEWSRVGKNGNDAPVELWSGSSGQLASEEYKETFFSPSDTEEWFELDTELNYNFDYLYTINSIPDYGVDPTFVAVANKLYHGSAGSMVWEAGKFEAEFQQYVDTIGPFQWLLREKNLMNNGRVADVRFPRRTEARGIYEDMSGRSSPIIRGGMKISFGSNRNTVHASTDSYSKGPELEIDAGVWGLSESIARRIAEDVGELCTTPLTVQRLVVFFDMDYKIGRCTRVELPTGGEIKIFITGVEHAPAENETRLSGRCYW